MNRQYHLFDAQGKVLGRLATEIAGVLSGKKKVDFTPNEDKGDFVVVINSDMVTVTGNKAEGKKYYHHSGHPGGITETTFREQMEKDSRKVIEDALFGMLPKNKLRSRMLKRLLIYTDDQHKHKIEVKH